MLIYLPPAVLALAQSGNNMNKAELLLGVLVGPLFGGLDSSILVLLPSLGDIVREGIVGVRSTE